MAGWDVRRVRGAAADVHARELDAVITRSVTVVEVDAPAIVLGSTQPDSDVDVEAAAHLGVSVVRRRSGGGAVLLEPDGAVWIDVEIGRDDQLWKDDVSRSMLWLGRSWTDALAVVDAPRAVVHEGEMLRSTLATVVCFAGLAPGEVTVDGAKVVGISQRRTRAGARFQCAVPRRWSVEQHGELLAPGLARCEVTEGLETVAVRTLDASVDAIVDAFTSHLP